MREVEKKMLGLLWNLRDERERDFNRKLRTGWRNFVAFESRGSVPAVDMTNRLGLC